MELMMGKHSLPNWYRAVRFSSVVINLMILSGILYYESNEQAVVADKTKKLGVWAMKGEDLNKKTLL
jgi:hypothetical protein